MIEFVEITAIEGDDPSEEEVFDFSSPENVLIHVILESEHEEKVWENYTIETCSIIWGKNEGVTGAASYEASYGGFLDYTIEAIIDCPGEGWFVVENVTGYYSKGDGWMTDDDMDFYFTGVRPATQEEIALA